MPTANICWVDRRKCVAAMFCDEVPFHVDMLLADLQKQDEVKAAKLVSPTEIHFTIAAEYWSDDHAMRAFSCELELSVNNIVGYDPIFFDSTQLKRQISLTDWYEQRNG